MRGDQPLRAAGFAAATEALTGRTRTYFAGDQQTLLANGTHTKPKHVPGTPYWVITNTNTSRKQNMVAQLMNSMGYDEDLTARVCGAV